MKKLTVLSMLTMVIFFCVSCKKDTVTTPSSPSIMSLLTGKQWEVDTAYFSYTGPGTGTLVYARGGSSNSTNLNNNRETFWPDGQYDAFDNSGNYISEQWSFSNPDSTAYISTPTGGGTTTHVQILRLDATHFNVFDSTGHSLVIKIPKP